MTADPRITAWLDQDTRLARTVRTHPVAVQHVMRGEDSDEAPFAYPVGLFGVGHPELVAVGLDSETACGLLNKVADLVLEGRDLAPGEVITDDGVDVLMVEVLPDPAEVLFSANRFVPAAGRVLRSRLPAHLGAGRRHLLVGPALPGRAGVPAPPGNVAGLTALRTTAQSRPSSRRSLATWPVALTL